MADIKKSPEIVTEQELKPVLESKAFDSATFLRLYNEWKATKDTGTFAALRKMHEDAGYNNKAIMPWSSEQEMHEIAAIVQRYADAKKVVTAQTATDVNATAATLSGSNVQKEKNISEAKAEIETAIKEITPEDIAKLRWTIEKVEKLLETLKLSPSDSSAIRGYTGQMILERLSQGGYRVTLEKWKAVLQSSSQDKRSNAVAIEGILNQHPNTLQNIAIGLIYRSSEFDKYIEVNSQWEWEKKTIKQPSEDYISYLKKARSNSPENQDLLRSQQEVQKIVGSEKMQDIMLGRLQVKSWMQANTPVIVQVLQQSNTPQTVSTSVQQSNTASSTPSSAPTKNLLAKYLGKAGLSIEGGASDIINTPWALPALLIAFIATWVFGDFKKALMVLAWGFGVSAAANAYAGNEKPATGVDTPKKKPKVSVEAPPAKPIDKKWLEWARLVATERVEKNPDIASMVETVRKSQIKKWGVEIGDTADYLSFINIELQNRKASEIVNPNDFKFSMFSDERMFDRAGKNNLDPMLLKRVLRIYLWVDMRLMPVQGKKTWEAEQQAFTEKYKKILINQNSTLKDLIENVK